MENIGRIHPPVIGTGGKYHEPGPEDRGESVTASQRFASLRRRRPALVGLVALSLVVAATAPAPASTGAAGGFADVDEDSVHEPAISALAEMGLFEDTLCEDGFCPGDPMERWVMAVWLIRALGGEVTTAGTSRFADVDATRWWSRYAEELADREITKGCKTEPLRYCPDGAVTRAEMASFLVRAFDLEPAQSSAAFTDVSEGNVHEANVDALFAAGITKGCKTEPLRYCPDGAVTRAEMATFLHRALIKQEETTGPASVEISDDVPDADLTDVSTGDTVNLRSLFTGDKAVMFWFWAEW